MISGKHLTKTALILVSVVLILCVSAMLFYNKLVPVTNTSDYNMKYSSVLFDTSKVLEIEIKMDEEKWNEMLQNARQEVYYECDVIIGGKQFQKVGIRPKGNTSLSSIAGDPNNNRYSFKLEFDRFVDGQTCFGLDKLVLNNSYADTTNMKEAIIYDMFQYLDADASLYNFAKISVNNEYWGVYLALEAVEDSFMLRNFGTEKGYLYKPDSMDRGNDNKNKNNNRNGNNKNAFGNNFPEMPQGEFPAPGNFEGIRQDKNTQRSSSNGTNTKVKEKIPTTANGDSKAGQENSKNFFQGSFANADKGDRGGFFGGMGGGSNLNYTDDNLDSYSTIWNSQVNDSNSQDHKRIVEALKNIHGRNNIEKYIDTDQIAKYMAVHNFSVNDDSLSGGMAHNYYLYEANGKISLLPWDYNLALGGMHGGNGTSVINDPIDDTWQSTRLLDFVFETEEYKALYHQYYNKLVNEYLYGGKFEETYNRIRSQIDSLVETDPNFMYSYDEYIKGTETLYEVILLRAESVKGQLDGSIPSTNQGQKTDSSTLIDASHVNLSDLGTFMGGGFGGGRNKVQSNQSETEKQP